MISSSRCQGISSSGCPAQLPIVWRSWRKKSITCSPWRSEKRQPLRTAASSAAVFTHRFVSVSSLGLFRDEGREGVFVLCATGCLHSAPRARGHPELLERLQHLLPGGHLEPGPRQVDLLVEVPLVLLRPGRLPAGFLECSHRLDQEPHGPAVLQGQDSDRLEYGDDRRPVLPGLGGHPVGDGRGARGRLGLRGAACHLPGAPELQDLGGGGSGASLSHQFPKTPPKPQNRRIFLFGTAV